MSSWLRPRKVKRVESGVISNRVAYGLLLSLLVLMAFGAYMVIRSAP
jgi:hypothetical protein